MNDVVPENERRESPNGAIDNLQRRHATRLYVLAALGCFLLAGTIWAVAQPEERTGPPVAAGGASAATPGADPHRHDDHEELHARIDALRQAVATAEASPEDHLLLANLLYDDGIRDRNPEAFAEASDLYATYLAVEPENPDARTDYAFTLFQTGRLEQAIAELLRVQRQNPQHQNSAFNLAVMYKERDLPDSVLYYMERTVAIDSTTRTGEAALEVLRAYSGAH